jgi:hypothetical protein
MNGAPKCTRADCAFKATRETRLDLRKPFAGFDRELHFCERCHDVVEVRVDRTAAARLFVPGHLDEPPASSSSAAAEPATVTRGPFPPAWRETASGHRCSVCGRAGHNRRTCPGAPVCAAGGEGTGQESTT